MKFKSLITVGFAIGVSLLNGGAHAGLTGSEFASGTGRALTCQHAKTRAQVAILQNRSIEVRGKATVRESIGECHCERPAYAEKLGVDTWTCTVNWGLDVQHR
jgi:hypothetical protein